MRAVLQQLHEQFKPIELNEVLRGMADAEALARAYWGIENGGHGRLDGSAFEDQCRVRHPVAATVLGWLRRFVHGEYATWAHRQTRARDRTQPTSFARPRGDPAAAVRFVTTLAARLLSSAGGKCELARLRLPPSGVEA